MLHTEVDDLCSRLDSFTMRRQLWPREDWWLEVHRGQVLPDFRLTAKVNSEWMFVYMANQCSDDRSALISNRKCC